MKAWTITKAGAPDVLEWQDAPTPEMGPSDVRVRVHAAGLNRADLLQRQGLYPAPAGASQDVPGLEYAGVVDAVGSNVQGRRPGDRVMGLIGGGAYAEQLVVHERETLTVPDTISLTDAAAIPEAFLTAYRALFLEGGLQPGGWCLIRAATSGIGIAGMQLARAFGARTVGTSRSVQRLEQVRHWGLDVAHAEEQGPLLETIRQHTGEGVNVILDLVGGGGQLRENMECLRPEGTQVVVGLMAGREDDINMGMLLFKRLTLRAMTMRSLPVERRIALAQLFSDRLAPFFAEGRLKPVVDTVLPFDQAPEAHQRMEAGEHTGKIVLTTET
ncbi:NAD(P)H-quinone oxidoreductase [Aquisalimonas sp. 2447]|uniref:NAD(P)H-quinone oxidoreductase n=1 Tax=Aquisalimonas sp. 2447 TaxID=2740807 RepID=UPI00143231D8|nr:NAD(P)H-quinone oxidoreductase [Aquisalimonas sp. 2447]QIT54356.1 NAD(P)H-quinone oxidoreductase [Aquisalimonas sp. 2447]